MSKYNSDNIVDETSSFFSYDEKKSYLKMPSEIQISSKSGSVLIMDSRLWHSPPPYNNKGTERISVVNRWSPWWLSINDYAPDCSYDVVCRPLSEGEYKKMPSKLKPFLVHLCPSMKENIQRKSYRYRP